MQLIERAQSILLKPKQTWPVIAVEPGDVASLYTRYLVVLAAIPAVAGFIGGSIIGYGGFGFSVRVPIVYGLVRMILGYLLSLGMVFVLGLIVNALAPTFGGVKNQVQAMKLVAYGCTAGFLGGVFMIIPWLGILYLVAACYSIYLIYTGIPVLMRCPPDKAGAYTAVVMVCGLVAGIVLAGIMALVSPASPIGLGAGLGAGSAGNMTISRPDGSNITINGNSMTEMAKRMEEAGKRMETAQKSGDNAAAGKAMGDILGAVTGNNGKPMAAADLKAMLPEAVGDLRRNSIEASSGEAMGIGGSTAKAGYVNGDRRVQLTITDSGGLAGLAAMAGWANMTMDKETDGKIEKIYKDGGRTLHEEYRKDGSHGALSVILANGVIVEAEGDRVDIDSLKKLVASLDLGRIEAVKRAAK